MVIVCENQCLIILIQDIKTILKQTEQRGGGEKEKQQKQQKQQQVCTNNENTFYT